MDAEWIDRLVRRDFPSGDLLASQLRAAGIDTVFGVVAAPMIPVQRGVAVAGIRCVMCRHEQQATFMAQAWGAIRRRPGVVIVGSGPALTNTLTSMYVARANGWPLAVIAGSSPGRERGIGSFQELDQERLAAQICRWTGAARTVEQLPELLRSALSHALGPPPGPAYLEVPADVVYQEAVSCTPRELVMPLAMPPRAAPETGAIEDAGAMLSNAERPLIVVGEGSAYSDAGAELTRLADMGIPFLASPMARGVVDDTHRAHVGASRGRALREADAVVLVGSRFDWMYPMFDRVAGTNRRARLIQIADDTDAFFGSADVQVMVLADIKLGAAALAAYLEDRGSSLPRRSPEWLDALIEEAEKRRAAVGHLTAESLLAGHLTQASLFGLLSERLENDDVVVTDGEVTPGAGRVLLPAPGGSEQRFDMGRTGCMGVGVPYAIGAKLAKPERRVVAVLGDYAFGASAMELETAARVRASTIFIVANNSGVLGHDLQEAMFADTGQPLASLLPADYELIGEMVGGLGRRARTVEELRGALDDAWGFDGVVVVNALLHTTDHGFQRHADYLTGGLTIRQTSASSESGTPGVDELGANGNLSGREAG